MLIAVLVLFLLLVFLPIRTVLLGIFRTVVVLGLFAVLTFGLVLIAGA